MRVIFFICERYKSYNIRKSSNLEIVIASSAKKRVETMRNCLGVFICMELLDGLKETKRCLKDIKKICQKNKLRNILLAPFSHLSNKLANPKKALELILHIEEELQKNKYNVLRSSFGYHKNLFLNIKGCNDNVKWKDYTKKSG